MKKITLLLATMFAVVCSAMADVPNANDVGYLYNTGTGRFVNKSAKLDATGAEFLISEKKDCGDSFGSDDGSIKEAGYTYLRFKVNGSENDFMRMTSSGVSCSSNGYHKWAVKDTDKGLVIRCIYTSTQSDGALNPFAKQGYYLSVSVKGDGTASLVLLEEPTDASYWKYAAGDAYETAKAEAEELFEKAVNAAIAEETAKNKELLKDMKAGDDITALVVKNGNFDDGTNGWTIYDGKIEVKAASSGNPVVTAYNYTFEVGQTLRGMTKGWYKLQVQAFSRSASNTDVLTLLEAGTELENNCVIYANAEEKNVVNLTDEMQKEQLTDYKEYTYKGETIYLPDGSTAFAAAFTKGLYENELNFEVGDDGIITLGVKNTKSPSDQGPTYCGYDNFRLIYLGEDPATGISTVSKKVPAKTIFNAAGQQLKSLQKGLNIVDGKKIMVK